MMEMRPSGAVVPLHAQVLGSIAERVCTYALALGQRVAQGRARARAVFILLCVGCVMALGAASPSPPASATQTATADSYAFTADSLIDKISDKVTNTLENLKKNADLRNFGNVITAFLLGALLVWSSVKTMATGRGLGELIGEWVPIFVAFGIVNLFLDRDASDLIVRTMDAIGTKIGGADMSSLKSAIRAGAEPIFKAIAAVVSQPRATEGTNVIGDGGLLGWLGTLAASGASWVMGAIAKVAAAFCLVLAGCFMVAQIIMGFVSVELVLALAPVMVPFLMFRPLEFLFSGWLKFLLGACMLKIVLAFLLSVAAGLLAGMTELAQQMYRDSWQVTAMETLYTDILLLGMMLVFAVLATLLVAQAPKIAEGLLSGAAGSAGFGGLKAVTHGAAGHASGAAGKAATGLAGGVAGAFAQGTRNYLGRTAGRSDALAGKKPSLAYRDGRAKAAYATAYRKHSTGDDIKPPST
jgi:hypothetical protein